MTLKIDLVMFQGIGRAGCNLTVWRGDVPTRDQLEALRKYVEQAEKEQNHEESEFI